MSILPIYVHGLIFVNIRILVKTVFFSSEHVKQLNQLSYDHLSVKLNGLQDGPIERITLNLSLFIL